MPIVDHCCWIITLPFSQKEFHFFLASPAKSIRTCAGFSLVSLWTYPSVTDNCQPRSSELSMPSLTLFLWLSFLLTPLIHLLGFRSPLHASTTTRWSSLTLNCRRPWISWSSTACLTTSNWSLSSELQITTTRNKPQLLLEHGANPNTCNNKHQTPLHQVSKRADLFEVLHLLSEHGADLNVEDKDGKTPLQLALDRGFNEVAQLLSGYSSKPTSSGVVTV